MTGLFFPVIEPVCFCPVQFVTGHLTSPGGISSFDTCCCKAFWTGICVPGPDWPLSKSASKFQSSWRFLFETFWCLVSWRKRFAPFIIFWSVSSISLLFLSRFFLWSVFSLTNCFWLLPMSFGDNARFRIRSCTEAQDFQPWLDKMWYCLLNASVPLKFGFSHFLRLVSEVFFLVLSNKPHCPSTG